MPKATKQRTKISPKARKLLYVGGGVVAAGALVFAGSNIAAALTAGSNYRTATVEEAAVTETVSANGTIAAASRSDVAFQTDGTVAGVTVSVGDTVTAGQTLATLDEADLEEAIAEAEQAVTDATQTLADHQESQTSGSTSSTSSVSTASASSGGADTVTLSNTTSAVISTANLTTSSTEPGGTDPAGNDSEVAAAVQKVTDAQTALLAKYQEVQGEIDATNGIIATASDVCQIFLTATLSNDESGAEAGEDGSAAESADAELDAATTAGMTLAEAQDALAACQTEIASVQAGQASISAGQQEVQDLAVALDAAVGDLTQLIQAGDDSGSTDPSGPSDEYSGGGAPSGSGPTGAGESGGTGGGSQDSLAGGGTSGGDATGSGGMSGGSSATITAEQLLADQAAINVAEADLKIAEAQLAFASITSPIDGEVVAVSIAEGDSVSAGSDSAVITVVGEAGYVVDTTVSLTDIAKLAVGQSVETTVAATGAVYEGEVSSIGVLNVSTTSTPSFDVAVFVDASDELLIGGSARLAIETATVDDALTVPSSAIHRDGSLVTVNVLRDGESVAVDVELGAVGAERTEILSGVEMGDRVILADLSESISSDDSTESAGLTGLSGQSGSGVGGGSFPGGGGDFQAPPGGGGPGQ